MTTLFFMLVYHVPFFSLVFNHVDMGTFSGFLIFLSVSIALFVVTGFFFFLFSLISTKFLKYSTILFMLANSMAIYFVVTYHTILDKTMMSNVFNTNNAEALSYYQPKIVLYLFFLGVFPAYLFSRFMIQREKRTTLLLKAIGLLASGVLILYLNGSTWLWMDKYAKRLGALAMPWSYTINTLRYKIKEFKKSKKQILLPDCQFENKDKTIVVLVIGESARAKNFSLYGYKRQTNPSLENLDIKVLKAKSAATYTTASVHSMLSYIGDTSDDYEVLPNYLQRNGAHVIWHTNNWGEPSLKVASLQRAKTLKKECTGEGCAYDEVLLEGLEEKINKTPENTIFIVLHTSGSHGPSYYEKYPKSFEKFKPVCTTVDIQQCKQEEIENAYDNTILYTDYFLSKVITLLKRQHSKTCMIYASDHGESLGEKGFYLHGTPYTFAPDEQKEIPFIVWGSKSFLKDKKMYLDKNKVYSHQYIFHTILGAFSAKSTVYKKEYDIFHK